MTNPDLQKDGKVLIFRMSRYYNGVLYRYSRPCPMWVDAEY